MANKKQKIKIEIRPYADKRPYVLWRRVSTKKQEETELGLEAQVDIAKHFMQRDPVKIFTDVYSGTKLLECKGLHDAIEYCHKNDCVLVIAKTDRWRNTGDAIELLDEIGEGNLIFCDLPEFNRFILIILVEMWQRQAEMLSFNTSRAMEVIQRKIDEEGGYMTRAGKWKTHLGNPKGTDVSKATSESAARRSRDAHEWRVNNDGYKWVRRQVKKNRKLKDILVEFNEMHDEGLQGFSTRTGCKMNICTLSEWIKEIRQEL